MVKLKSLLWHVAQNFFQVQVYRSAIIHFIIKYNFSVS